jgi:hypothetical protein
MCDGLQSARMCAYVCVCLVYFRQMHTLIEHAMAAFADAKTRLDALTKDAGLLADTFDVPKGHAMNCMKVMLTHARARAKCC